ncbi:MAG: sensor histidine kinase [Candidatus Izemoplasmataceae bacterium]
MTSYIATSKRRNVLLITMLLTLIFLLINVSLYYLNESFVAEKIDEENHAFTTLTTHLINENDLSVAIEYMEHYSHTHEVELMLKNTDGETLFTTINNHSFELTYRIETLQGEHDILIDNTEGTTVDWASSYFLYVNASLIMIYIISVGIFLWMNKDFSKKITSDIDRVLEMMNEDGALVEPKNYQEFYDMYKHIKEYLEEIDLLREQKNMNVKGLVHDIKTPLTLMRHYIDIQEDSDAKSDALKALHSMNTIVQDLMSDDYHKSMKEIQVSQLLEEIVERYEGVFSSKDLKIDLKIETDGIVRWNHRDFTRVIENLLSNAFYYSFPHTSVEMIVKKEERLIIEIRNEAEELTSKEYAKLFDKGYRKEGTMKQNTEGQGLGLYSSKLLLSSINADITVFSEDKWIVVKITF